MIKQVWISTHFGVISKRPLAANETLGFINPTLTPPGFGCKGLGGVLQPGGFQAPVLRSRISTPGWAVSAKNVARPQVQPNRAKLGVASSADLHTIRAVNYYVLADAASALRKPEAFSRVGISQCDARTAT